MTEHSTLQGPAAATNGTTPQPAKAPEGEHERALGVEDRVAELIATWFGCGRAKHAPGTWGSLGAVPLHWVLSRLAPVPHALIVAAVTAAGIWAAGRRAEILCEKDPQSIVIDEVAGTLIALGIVRRKSLATQLAALVLFRILDITKPGLIDRAQHAKPIGVGIMADDVLAGLGAGLGALWWGRKR
ncbi:MAG TPA: phosphatidylglycerophosphatase A [Polyangiaceae bacterium]|nr:phosphatidylglycerophosphatase A [Polyangiaceae bacterium]